MGTGIALPTTHPVPTQSHTPGTPLPAPAVRSQCAAGSAGQRNSAVGLKSVEQLTLRLHFSGFQGMTEVYNLTVAGNPNDHNDIRGTE